MFRYKNPYIKIKYISIIPYKYEINMILMYRIYLVYTYFITSHYKTFVFLTICLKWPLCDDRYMYHKIICSILLFYFFKQNRPLFLESCFILVGKTSMFFAVYTCQKPFLSFFLLLVIYTTYEELLA